MRESRFPRMALLPLLLLPLIVPSLLGAVLPGRTSVAHAASVSWPIDIANAGGNELSTAPDGSVLVSNCTSDTTKLSAEDIASSGAVTNAIAQPSNGLIYLCDGSTGKAVDVNGNTYGIMNDNSSPTRYSLVGYNEQGSQLWPPAALAYVCSNNQTVQLTPHTMVMGTDGNVYAYATDYYRMCDGGGYLIKVLSSSGNVTITPLGTQVTGIVEAYQKGLIIDEGQDLRYVLYNGKTLTTVNTSEVSGGRIVASSYDGRVFFETFEYSNGTCPANLQYTTHFEEYGPSGLIFRFGVQPCWKVDTAGAMPGGGVAVLAYDATGIQNLLSYMPNSSGYQVADFPLPGSQGYMTFTGPNGGPSYAIVQTDTNGDILLVRQYYWQAGGATYLGYQFTLQDPRLRVIDEFNTNTLDAEQGDTQNFSIDGRWAMANGTLYFAAGRCPGADVYGCRDSSRYLYAVPMAHLGMDYPGGATLGVTSVPYACPALQFVGVRGSGESYLNDNGLGVPVDDVKNQLVASGVSMGVKAIAYPAVPLLYDGLTGYPDYYDASVKDGEVALQLFLTRFTQACPSSRLLVVGYSQGAQVAGDVVDSLSSTVQRRIVAMILFGDPTFNPTQSAVDNGTYNKTTYGIWVVIGNLPARHIPSILAAKSVSYCIKGDPVCNDDSLDINLANCKASPTTCPHLFYSSTWTTEAVVWLKKKL